MEPRDDINKYHKYPVASQTEKEKYVLGEKQSSVK